MSVSHGNSPLVALFVTNLGSRNGRVRLMLDTLLQAGYRVRLYTDAEGAAMAPDGVAVEICLRAATATEPITLFNVPDLSGVAVVQASGRDLLRQVAGYVPKDAKLIYDVPAAEPLPEAPEGAGLAMRGRAWLAGIKSSVGAWGVAPRLDAAICPSYMFGEFLQRDMKLKNVPVVPIYPALPFVESVTPNPDVWVPNKRPAAGVLGGDFADLAAAIHGVGRVRELDLVVINGHGDWQAAEQIAKSYPQMVSRMHRVDVPPEQVLSTLAGCEMGLVLPLETTQQDLYDIPTELFQFLMAGVPLVTSDLPGIERLVQAQNFGLLADPEDFEQVANQIGRVWSDRVNHERLLHNVELVRQHRYSWEVQSTRLLALYELLTGVASGSAKALAL